MNIDKNLTLNEITQYYLKNCIKPNYAQSSYDSYKSKMSNYVLPAIGAKPINDITKFDVQNLVYTLSNDTKLSPTSVRLIYCVLHKVMNFTLDMELTNKDVCRNINLPKQSKYTPKIYSKADIKRLINISKDNFLLIPILLASMLGLRRSEILFLRWSDIDLNNGKISVNKGKSTQSIRTLDISKTLLQALQLHKDEQRILLHSKCITQNSDTLIVCKSDGKPYNHTFISRKFNELLRFNNLPLIRFHDLRHAYATHSHNDGMPIKRLSKILGHSTAAMSVETYVHIDD